MKPLRSTMMAVAIALAATFTAIAQERTEETVTTTTMSDSAGSSTVRVVRVATVEDIRDLNNMVMINPFKFIYLFNASYYRALTPNIAVGGTLQAPTVLLSEYEDVKGFGIGGDFLFYPSSRVFRGFHVGANMSYDMVTYKHFNSETSSREDLTEHPFSIGGYLGWNWWPWEEFATEIAIGAEYNINPTSEAVLSPLGHLEGIAPYFSFKMGYAW